MQRRGGGMSVTHAEIEHRPAVISEIDAVLAVRDVDAVRQEEVGAEQHVDIAHRQLAEAQADLLDLLVAELDAVELADPVGHGALAQSTPLPSRNHALVAGLDPGPT